MKVPQHIAIILDGNGRWAKKRLMPRNYGHSAGAKNVETISTDAYDLGVKYVTVYAFSTENWNRPKKEVDTIMKLLKKYLKDYLEKTKTNNMVFRVIGNRSALPEDIVKDIEKLETLSKKNTGLNFTIAINYGSRDEILRAVKKVALDLSKGKIDEEKLTEEMFSSYLDTREIPDPDLVIRTSGELRLSNYLLWQLAYSEFYFTDVLWPDFNKKELIKAIDQYGLRERRFGKIREEKDEQTSD